MADVISKEELIARIALNQVPFVGARLFRELVANFGSAKDVFLASERQLKTTDGVGAKTAFSILSVKNFKPFEEEADFILKHQIQVLSYTDENYPKRLRELTDAPALLFYKGTANLNHPRIIGIVGTRRATTYGKELVENLMKDLAQYDVLTVSGLAYGIDITAHKESLKNNVPTIGVLAHGLQKIYPNAHRNTAVEMAKCGGLITEFKIGVDSFRENFPRRNRIVGGMVDALIVVETAEKGGSLITAEIAYSYNRELFTFPGRINDPLSKGCHYLLKNQKALLIESAKDVAFHMGWPSPETEKKVQIKKDSLNGIELEIFQLLLAAYGQRLTLDQICKHFKQPPSKLSLILLNMEFTNYIKSLPGKYYQIC